MYNRTFVVSDIHGCYNTFETLVETEVKLTFNDKLILLGDYIDRGPLSKQVIDYIIRKKAEGYNIVTLKGNHEDMLLKSVNDAATFDLWLNNGGYETLQSYGIKKLQDMPEDHMGFYKSLLYFYPDNGFIMVHAGMNFEITDPFQDKEAMLWQRTFVIDSQKIGNKILIHGHTPVSFDEVQRYIKEKEIKHEINIDNGCVYDNREGQGHLVALQLENFEVFRQINID